MRPEHDLTCRMYIRIGEPAAEVYDDKAGKGGTGRGVHVII